MTDRIEIQAPSESRTPSGQMTLLYPPAGGTSVFRWGRLVPKTAKEFDAASKQWAEMNWMIECRGRVDITPRHRVKAGSRFIDVIAAYGVDGREPTKADIITIVGRQGPTQAKA